MGVRTPALAGHPEPILVISTGETGKSCREFPGARPACRGTPETPADNAVCADGRSSARARTDVCARKDGYSPDDNVLCNVGMIREYWA